MQIYHNIDEFKRINNAVVTIGTFDGVHLGHQLVINQLLEVAEQTKGESVLLTFFPHPKMVLFPEDTSLKLLNSIDERIELLKQTGINHLIIHPFSKDFSSIPFDVFVKDILVKKLGVSQLIVGYNHQFGKQRKGTYNDLKALAKELNFVVKKISAQVIQQEEISSTKIRKALQSGDIEKANRYLTKPYSFTGKVVAGTKTGQSIGFPTANITLSEKYKLIPVNGVYAVKVEVLKKIYMGMLNIGNRPTFNGKEMTIEVNIFNFNQDIYGVKIRVLVIKKIRNEQKFETPAALKTQLINDKDKTLKVCASYQL